MTIDARAPWRAAEPWTPALDPTGPAYLALGRALESDIRSGRLLPGTRLPTHRALAEALGVNVGTVSRAYAEARRRGLVSGEVGRGTFVRTPSLPALAPRGDRAAQHIDLGLNVPLAEPAPDLRQALRDLARSPDLDALMGYAEPGGSPRARAAGAAWLRRSGVACEPNQVVVCSGSQHGLLVALAALAGPGERVLAEALTYPGFSAAARLLGLRVRPVRTDEHGLVPEALEAACEDRPRLLYCTPQLQNPTAAVLSPERAGAIAEIARRHDLAIVTDDVQAQMLATAGPALATLAPELVVTIGGVSKLLLPGLRTAFIGAATERIPRLAEMVFATTWMAPPLGAELAARWIEDGTAERVALARAEEMRRRGALAREVLAGLRVRTQPGAHHLWLELPDDLDGAGFAAALFARGVAVTPAESFLAAPGPVPRAVRLSLSGPPDIAMLQRGLEIVAALARGEAEPTRVRL